MSFVKNKLLWIGSVVVLIVILVFGLAMMGSVLSAKPKALPVALVVLDEGGQLPGGGSLAIGEMVQGKLLENQNIPIHWELVASEEAAREGMDEQLYYGAVVLPADLSTSVLSLMSPTPQNAEVEVLVNEGMHPQAASTVKQILGQVMNGVSLELSRQMLGMMGQQAEQISLSSAEKLLTLITVNEETLHPIGENHAGGNAANMLTQIVWLSSMVASVFLYLTRRNAVLQDMSRWTGVSLQTLFGLLIIYLASGMLVWMASSWYGMEIHETGKVWLFLCLAGTAFFLLQSSLLNWIGLPAVALLVLLLFFSMPVMTMAPEFLPQATRDWLYTWTPFRFAVEGLRELMYFGGPVSSAVSVLWWIVGIGLVLLLSRGAKEEASPVTTTAAKGQIR